MALDGWVRTRVFKVLDHSVVGTAVEKAQVSPYFVVHGASDDRELFKFVVLTRVSVQNSCSQL